MWEYLLAGWLISFALIIAAGSHHVYTGRCNSLLYGINCLTECDLKPKRTGICSLIYL